MSQKFWVQFVINSSQNIVLAIGIKTQKTGLAITLYLYNNKKMTHFKMETIFYKMNIIQSTLTRKPSVSF